MYLTFTRERWKELVTDQDPSPIHMLNLIRYAEKAGHPEGSEMSGAEGYAEYMRRVLPYLELVGARMVWQADARNIAIGPEEEHWDLAFLVEYPSTAAFVSMIADPGYQESASPYRVGSISDSRLIRTKPVG